jgi:hypothetical protein
VRRLFPRFCFEKGALELPAATASKYHPPKAPQTITLVLKKLYLAGNLSFQP